MKRFSHQTIIVLTSNLISAGLSFLIIALIARHLGQEALGYYSAILATIYPLTIAADFGISSLLTRELAQTDDPNRQLTLIRAALWIRVFLGLLLMIAVSKIAVSTTDLRLLFGFIYSTPLVLINPIINTYMAVYRAEGRFTRIALLTVGMLVAQVLLTIPAVAIHSLDLTIIINTATSFGQLIVILLTHPHPKRKNSTTTKLSLEMLHLLKRAWPFALAGVFASLQTRLVFWFLPPLEAGYFAAAWKLADFARLIPNAAFGVLSPILSANKRGDRVLYWRVMIALSYYGFAVAVIFYAIAPILVTLVYGNTYLPAVPILLLLGAGYLSNLLRSGLLMNGYAKGNPHLMNALMLIGLILFMYLKPSAADAQSIAIALLKTDTLLCIILLIAFSWRSWRLGGLIRSLSL